jgi:hypothetical protein
MYVARYSYAGKKFQMMLAYFSYLDLSLHLKWSQKFIKEFVFQMF